MNKILIISNLVMIVFCIYAHKNQKNFILKIGIAEILYWIIGILYASEVFKNTKSIIEITPIIATIILNFFLFIVSLKSIEEIKLNKETKEKIIKRKEEYLKEEEDRKEFYTKKHQEKEKELKEREKKDIENLKEILKDKNILEPIVAFLKEQKREDVKIIFHKIIKNPEIKPLEKIFDKMIEGLSKKDYEALYQKLKS